MEDRAKVITILLLFFDPSTQFPGNEKIHYAIQKSIYKSKIIIVIIIIIVLAHSTKPQAGKLG